MKTTVTTSVVVTFDDGSTANVQWTVSSSADEPLPDLVTRMGTETVERARRAVERLENELTA